MRQVLDPTRVAGLITIEGGPTSHTAILAKNLGIPAVVACRQAGVLGEGEPALLDGGSGRVTSKPSGLARAAATARAVAVKELVAGIHGPGPDQ